MSTKTKIHAARVRMADATRQAFEELPNERFARAQANRRKTLFSLTSATVCVHRMAVAWGWHKAGYSYAAIRQILNLRGPDEARRLVAKANRQWANWTKAPKEASV